MPQSVVAKLPPPFHSLAGFPQALLAVPIPLGAADHPGTRGTAAAATRQPEYPAAGTTAPSAGQAAAWPVCEQGRAADVPQHDPLADAATASWAVLGPPALESPEAAEQLGQSPAIAALSGSSQPCRAESGSSQASCQTRMHQLLPSHHLPCPSSTHLGIPDACEVAPDGCVEALDGEPAGDTEIPGAGTHATPDAGCAAEAAAFGLVSHCRRLSQPAPCETVQLAASCHACPTHTTDSSSSVYTGMHTCSSTCTRAHAG